jgi:membrane-bound ClpP family serine protease
VKSHASRTDLPCGSLHSNRSATFAIGSVGLAVTDLKPRGEIRVLGEFWQATAKEGEIKTGEKVEVVGMEGMLLVVKPVKEKV